MRFYDCAILLFGPLVLLYIGVQVIVPPLATLLSDATWQAFGDVSPVPGSWRRHDPRQDLVLVPGPGALGKMAAVVELKPARVALDLRLAGQQLADPVPAVLAKLINVANQFLVLLKF